MSADLATALQCWADWHNRHQPAADRDEREIPPTTDDDWRRWRDAGATLAGRLAGETGAEVVCLRAEGHAGATGCPHCGTAASRAWAPPPLPSC